MTLEEAIAKIKQGNCILFTGSGFSIGATSMQRDADGKYMKFRIGGDVVADMGKLCGLTEQQAKEARMTKVSEFCRRRIGDAPLIDFLKREFTVREITNDQRKIGQLRWRRVYTTNYDTIFEKAFRESGRNIESLTMSHNPRENGRGTFCLHVNGHIDNLSSSTLENEFRLTTGSYNSDYLLKSPWGNTLRNDLLDADAVFFIGFSGDYDLDLTRLFVGTRELREKSFFILHHSISPVQKEILECLGSVHPIDLSGFTRLINREMVSPSIDLAELLPPAARKLVSFAETKPFSVKPKIISRDVRELFIKGNVNDNLLDYSTREPGGFIYSIYRERIDRVIEEITEGEQRFVVHSRLGNGKSIFLKALAYKLTRKEFPTFFFRERRRHMLDELAQISESNLRPVVIIDNFTDDLDTFRDILEHAPINITIIAASRSYRLELVDWRQEENWKSFCIDKMTPAETTALIRIFNQHALWKKIGGAREEEEKREWIVSTCRSELSRVMMATLDSEYLQQEYRGILNKLSASANFYEAVIFLLLNAYFKFTSGYAETLETIGGDVLNNLSFQRDPDIREIVDFENERMLVNSAVFAEYLLAKHVDKRDLTRYLINLFEKMDGRAENNSKVRRILKKMMRYSELTGLLRTPDRIYDLYDNISRLPYCSRQPLFWLQYAIARTVSKEFGMASDCFDYAYALAGADEGFNTYQIDNHHAHLLLLRAIQEEDKSWTDKTPIELFREIHSKLNKRTNGDEQRYYQFKVARDYHGFWKRHKESFSPEEHVEFLDACRSICIRAEQYLKQKALPERNRTVAQECLEKLWMILK